MARERKREMLNMVALFLFLEGMMGALAPFSYLVINSRNVSLFCKVAACSFLYIDYYNPFNTPDIATIMALIFACLLDLSLVE